MNNVYNVGNGSFNNNSGMIFQKPSLLEKMRAKKRSRNISKELDELQEAVNSLQNIISRETDKDWKEYFTAELEAKEAEIKYLQKKQEMIWRVYDI